ncbi:MAG: hypothetical protein ABIW46_05230 [Acidimicrobiales bacterium]
MAVLFVLSLVLSLSHEPASLAAGNQPQLRARAAAVGPPLLEIPAVPPLLPTPIPLLPGLAPAPGDGPPGSATTAHAGPAGLAPYRGMATWIDVYDWSDTFTGGRPTVTPGDVARMAEVGVQTMFIQASKHDSPTDVLEPERLGAFVSRARAAGIKVVAWYLPTLVDVGKDLARLKAVAQVPGMDGVAVDIEARNVANVTERSRRLVELSRALRQALPGRVIGAAVMPPVQIEVVNPRYWPAFPYREIAPFYDVWMPMGYWTFRTPASGYRDPYAYTKENVIRLRRNVGDPNLAVHPIGGIGTGTTAADVEAFKRAITEVGGFGGSLYDWNTTASSLWPRLATMRVR